MFRDVGNVITAVLDVVINGCGWDAMKM